MSETSFISINTDFPCSDSGQTPPEFLSTKQDVAGLLDTPVSVVLDLFEGGPHHPSGDQ